MSIKELVETARDLGIVPDGMDRAELGKEIDQVAKAQSMTLAHPLEWLKFGVRVHLPMTIEAKHELKIGVWVSEESFRRIFPTLYTDAEDIPVGIGPLLIRVFPGMPLAVLQTTGGGILATQVKAAVKDQLEKRWNGDDLEELYISNDGGSTLNMPFTFRRVGHIFYVDWEASPVVGEKRARE